MSYQIMTEDEEGVQVGTSQGWPDFCEWVDELEGGFEELDDFCEEGDSFDVKTLASELRQALKSAPPEDDVHSTAIGVLKFLDDHPDAEMIMITNGMTVGEGEDE